MDRATLIQTIEDAGLAHLLPDLDPVIAPAIRLVPIPGKTLEIGSTRLGGLPDLPPLTPWPVVDGIALMFIAQVRLEDLTDPSNSLPTEGLLSFFFDGALTGYDCGEGADRSCVIYTNTASSTWVERSEPSSVPGEFRVFAPTGVETREVWTIPAFEELDGNEFADMPAAFPIIHSRDDRDAYRAMRRPLLTYTTRLLGHPDEVQGGEVRFGAVCTRDAGERYRYENYRYTNATELAGEIKDLVMLLQSTSEPNSDVSVAGGALQFWISKSDLAAGRFDRAWATLTCS